MKHADCADDTVHDQGGSNTLIRKDGHLLLVALDWVKAFDSISPAGLVKAMSRFGIPYHFCSVARGIYKWRRNFSPAPPMLWHFPRLSFITFSVLGCHDDAHSRCEGYLPLEKGPSQNRRNQRIDVDMRMTPYSLQPTMKMLKFTCSASKRLGACMGCN